MLVLTLAFISEREPIDDARADIYNNVIRQ
jgi:hypothetical protein